jgi:cellulose synthase/poly-beta-1,6-N-acetylglucosamine synthase-like glycosyltransferase
MIGRLTQAMLTPISWATAAILFYFTLRRWLFIFFALKAGPKNQVYDRFPDQAAAGFQTKPPPVNSGCSFLPPVLLLAPIRNEAETLPELLAALDRLLYPRDQLAVVFIDDGSTDNSAALLQSWVKARAHWRLLPLAQNVGKAHALNMALAEFSGQAEIVVIYDADERPLPDALERLVQPFIDERVGGVSGRRAISNSLASPAASYTAFEGLVHQFITLRAKDRLKLAPAILGANCAYRRVALLEAGGFKPGALLEDSDLTLKLTRLGWQLRFEPGAISYHHAPQTISGYWKQHTRWARGFNDVAKEQAGSVLFDRRLPFLVRLELATFALGYIDRVALIAGGMLALLGKRIVAWAIVLSLLTPFVQIVAALKIAGQPWAMWRRVMWVPLFFGLDMAMATVGFLNMAANLPQAWEERRARK